MKRTVTFYPLTRYHSKSNEPVEEKRRVRKVVSPSESVIRNLLNYSRALQIIRTQDAGMINLLMN
jgi:hypothetical protein